MTFWKRRSHLTDLVDMIPPDFSYIQKILLPLFYTIQMSVTGTVLGTFFALVLSPFGAANLGFPAVIRRILRIVIQILRSFPALILALTATFLFGLGTFAGTFAITLYTFAIMTKLTYEDASAADVKAYQALRAMGVSKYVAYIHGILPEIIPGFLTNALYLLETNVRHSSILGYVGAGGIGLLLNEKISWLEYSECVTRCSNWATSAWKERVCLLIGVQKGQIQGERRRPARRQAPQAGNYGRACGFQGR